MTGFGANPMDANTTGCGESPEPVRNGVVFTQPAQRSRMGHSPDAGTAHSREATNRELGIFRQHWAVYGGSPARGRQFTSDCGVAAEACGFEKVNNRTIKSSGSFSVPRMALESLLEKNYVAAHHIAALSGRANLGPPMT
jgi:hypothetical protein